MKNLTAIIAARMGSSRFPGKTLADLHGRPMIDRLRERMLRSESIDRVVIATTDLPADDTLETWCNANGVGCFRGSADDVLGRLCAAAVAFDCDGIVEVLGDNPLVHAAMIDESVELFRAGGGNGYACTVTNEYPLAPAELKRFPIGIRVQVFSKNLLLRCGELAKSAYNREHATSYIAENPELFGARYLDASGARAVEHRPELTFAVNERKNLELINHIFGVCYDRNPNFSVADAVAAFDAHPEWKPLMGA